MQKSPSVNSQAEGGPSVQREGIAAAAAQGEERDPSPQPDDEVKRPSGGDDPPVGSGPEGEDPNGQTSRAGENDAGDPKKHRRTTISKGDFRRAFVACKGNKELMAEVLDLTVNLIENRIRNTPDLWALYTKDAPDRAPNEIETLVRTERLLPEGIEHSHRAEQLMEQDREMLRHGLQKAGIEPATIKRMRARDGLARNAGAFLSVGLDYTHRLHIYSTAALFEEMIHIRENYLRDKSLTPMERVFWQRAFNEIADLLGKSYDRTLAGTQAMVQMINSQNKPKGQKSMAKPAWQESGGDDAPAR